jgi:hypothetical protein
MAKKNVVQFRATDTEYAVLTLAAKQAGVTVSELVRDKLFGGRRVAETEDAGSGEHLRQEGADRGPEGKLMANSPSLAGSNPAPATNRLDGDPIYKSHPKSCACFLCNSARQAGLK